MMSGIRCMLVCWCVAAVGLGASSGAAGALNVLFIAVDDLRPELGCYGSAAARTPHLDRLASEGVRFTNHFVAVPTCGASRYALLTGRSAGRSGVTRSNDAFYRGGSALSRRMLDGAQTLPELFRRSGYRTVCIGKISHTPDGKVYAYHGEGDGREELPHAWDELPTKYGAWKRGWGTFFAYEGGRHREDGRGHLDLMEFKAERDEDLPDGMMAKQAVEKLGELKEAGKPFFLAVGFFKPHLPFVATRGDWEAMEKVEVGAAEHDGKWASKYWHRSGEFFKYESGFERRTPLAKTDQIKARRAYLACVRYVDRQVGKVVEELDRLGLADSTVVVVWGDHGWHLGESAIWGKHSPFERALRSPLIVRLPGVARKGVACEALVETTDIYPTLMELCDPSFKKTRFALDGASLKGLLTGEKRQMREAAISYWGNAVSVRTATHRLVMTMKDGKASDVELFDLRMGADPVENVAGEEKELMEKLMGYVRAAR